jgi:NADPH:quinone reductase-like Zn-dependent oxidoreductase
LKAIIYTKYGGPEVLHLAEVDKPVPADDEVLVKVYATSVNDWDWGLLQADWFNKLMSGWSKPKRQIIGSDIAGRVETVGKNVQKFRPGDEVFGDLSGRWGGFAEYVCAPEKSLAIKSPAMTFEEAAAIPQAGMLMVQGLIDKGKIQKGEKVLFNGAGGGVGTFGIQVAKLYGAEITAVDSAEKLDMLRSLGATHVIDYKKEDFTRTGKQYDLILDVKTNRLPLSYLRALTSRGRYMTVGGDLGKLLQVFSLSPLISMFTRKKVSLVVLKANKDLEYMKELFESGKARPVIDGHYKLQDVPEAFRIFGKAAHKGKLVISII